MALNPLKHGCYAVNLPEKLFRAGYRQSEAEWRQIRGRIARTFQRTFAVPGPEATRPTEPQQGERLDRRLGTTVSVPSFEKKMDWLANTVWCASKLAGTRWSKAEDFFEIS